MLEQKQHAASGLSPCDQRGHSCAGLNNRNHRLNRNWSSRGGRGGHCSFACRRNSSMTGLPVTGSFIILKVISEAKRRAAQTLPSARQKEEVVRAMLPNQCNAERNSAHTGFLISCRAIGT